MTDAAGSPTPKGQLWFVRYLDETKPWRSRTLLPLKPTDLDLAIRDRRGRVATFENQKDFNAALLDGSDAVDRSVAVPAYDRWFPAILMWEPREDVKPRGLAGMTKPLVITLLLGWLFFDPPRFIPVRGVESKMIVFLLLMFFGLMPLCTMIIRAWEDSRDRSPGSNKLRQVELVFFHHWLRSFSTINLRIALALLAAIYLVQVFGGVPWMSLGESFKALFHGGGGVWNSVMDAALVKSSVLQQRQWWRLLTAGVMHASLLHLFFNGLALYLLGRIALAIVGPSLLGLVFLTSIVGGSLTSLWLPSGLSSVGASGGVMGVLGFLTVILVAHRAGVPRIYKAGLIQAIFLMGAFGALGAQFIDNAAHGGGLLAGGLLGIALVPRSQRVWEYQPGLAVKVLGWLSWALLAVAGLGVIRIILDW